MSEPAIPDPPAPSLADENLRANLRALAQTQPALIKIITPLSPPLTFIFARDGSLTARDPAGRWATGCSLPHRAATAMLQSLQDSAPLACFLEPSHAAQLAVALGRIERPHALLAVVTDPQMLRFILQCHDFSSDLASMRLWFAAGENWSEALADLLQQRPGLPIPSAYIRLQILDDARAQNLITRAGEVFSTETARRSQRLNQIKSDWQPRPRAPKIAIVSPGHFRLWDDVGWQLAEALLPGSPDFAPFDPDQPTCASPLAFAEFVVGCDAVLTAGVFRADLPDLLHPNLPWISFATTSRILPPVQGANRDRLIIIHPSQRDPAQTLGWPANNIALLPPHTSLLPPSTPKPQTPNPALVLIADTRTLAVPDLDLSSHQLLWELIAAEIAADPFIMGQDLNRYLDSRRQQLEIAPEGFNRPLVIDRLIAPAFAQAIARRLIDAGVNLIIHGQGWQHLPNLAPRHQGTLTTRQAFHDTLNRAAALLHIWPTPGPHPIDLVGLPVVRAHHPNQSTLLQSIRQTLAAPPPTTQPLAASFILNLLNA